MSGKPSSEGVQLFRQQLSRYVSAVERSQKLTGEINDRTTELNNQRIEADDARTKMFKIMADMDVLANYNYGYEPRASWFLAELYKQMESR